MVESVQLDLLILLPEPVSDTDPCVGRLTALLGCRDGVDDVHAVRSTTPGEPDQLCVHFDPGQIGAGRIRHLAESTGAEVTAMFGHVLWRVTGVGHARRAASIADLLSGIAGVAEVDVVPGRIRLEVDRRVTSEAAIREQLRDHGVAIEPSPTRPRDGAGHTDIKPSHDAVPHEDHGDEEDADHDHGGQFGERSELIFAVVSLVLWISPSRSSPRGSSAAGSR